MSVTTPTAILILTGSELTRGATRDSNGHFLATQLERRGVVVRELAILPDHRELIAARIRQAMNDADIVLVSGGLGPTADDLTIEILAKVLGRDVIRDPEAMRRMKQRATARGLKDSEIPPNYFKQAEVLAGSEVALNPVGLAPGCIVKTGRGLLATMPGVPRELEAMFLEVIGPAIEQRFSLAPPITLRAKIFGRGESWVEAKVAAWEWDRERIEYGISARPGELSLHFRVANEAGIPLLDQLRERLVSEFGDALYLPPPGESDDRLAAVVHRALLAARKTIATAESCSGGLVAARLTDRGGASSFYLGSVIAYHNDIKKDRLGVPETLLAAHGAVSPEVAAALAIGARSTFGADLGLGITGIAGPDGGTGDKPVGLVYVALATPHGEPLIERHHLPGDRATVREGTVMRALDLVRRRLLRAESG